MDIRDSFISLHQEANDSFTWTFGVLHVILFDHIFMLSKSNKLWTII